MNFEKIQKERNKSFDFLFNYLEKVKKFTFKTHFLANFTGKSFDLSRNLFFFETRTPNNYSFKVCEASSVIEINCKNDLEEEHLMSRLSSSITVVRGLCNILNMDLSVFQTEALVQVDQKLKIDVRFLNLSVFRGLPLLF
jgi:hypothetical protein